MALLTSLSRFSPANCEPELLERMLVGRHALAARFERDVIQCLESGAGIHNLVIGPRGAGKTHLLAVVHNRVVARDQVPQQLVVAYLKEEERGVASFLDFLVRILRALNRRGSEAGKHDDALRALTKVSLRQARDQAQRLLEEIVGDRRLLLIVENLGMLFSNRRGMGPEGQKRLRDFIQQRRFCIVLASAQSLFADVQRGEAPFYGFFKVHHLSMFTFEESMGLLCNLARNDKRHKLRAFLGTAEGRGRVRAIHELTGGNPRLLVIFYQFIDSNAISDLATSFLEMVDSLTAYYQEQMQPLPALQQKIIEFLCEHRTAAQVKEIARSCFVSEQSASKQLKLLTDSRYLTVTREGRKSFYELREPMFRICFEIKQNMGYPIALFMDFLGRFYSLEELRRKHRGAELLRRLNEYGGNSPLDDAQTEIGYLREAMTRYHDSPLDDDARAPLQSEDIKATLRTLIDDKEWRYVHRVADAAMELGLERSMMAVAAARSYRELGDLDVAWARVEDAIERNAADVDAWCERGRIADARGDRDEARACLRRAHELDPEHVETLVWLGREMLDGKDEDQGRVLLERAVELEPSQGAAWRLLGQYQCSRGDTEEGLRSLRRATEVDPSDAMSWAVLSFEGHKGGANEEALRAAERAVSLSLDVAVCWVKIGIVFERNGRWAEARDCYVMVTEIAPENPRGWTLKAEAEMELGDLTRARHSMVAAGHTEVADISERDLWVLLGQIRYEREDVEGAARALARAAELSDDPKIWDTVADLHRERGAAEDVCRALERATALRPEDASLWRKLGAAYIHINEDASARDCYQKIVELVPDSDQAWMQLGMVQVHAADYRQALKSLRRGLPAFGENAEPYLTLSLLERIFGDGDAAEHHAQRGEEIDDLRLIDMIEYYGLTSADPDMTMQLTAIAVKEYPDHDKTIALLRHTMSRLSGGQRVTQELLNSVEVILAQDRERHALWHVAGHLHFKLGDVEEGHAAFGRAIELAPDHVPYKLTYADSVQQFGERADAVAILERAVVQHPSEPRLWARLATMRREDGGRLAQREVLERAAEALPDDGHLWAELAWACQISGEVEQALRCARRATEVTPEAWWAWSVMSFVLEERRDYEVALEAAVRAADLKNSDAGLRASVAQLAFMDGDVERAQREAAAAREMVGDDAIDLNILGEAYRIMGEFDHAVEFYERAIAVDSTECMPHMNLAIIEYQREHYDAAVDTVRRTLELGKEHPWDEDLVMCVNDLSVHLLMKAPIERLPRVLGELESAFSAVARTRAFLDGLSVGLMKVIERHDEVSTARLEQLAALVVAPLLDHEELSQAAQLFRTAARYLATKDTEVLLELPLEQRRRVEAAVGVTPARR